MTNQTSPPDSPKPQPRQPICRSCFVKSCKGCRPYNFKKGGLQGTHADFAGRIADHEFPGVGDMDPGQNTGNPLGF